MGSDHPENEHKMMSTLLLREGKSMRTILIAGCYFCLLSGAFADCDSDAKAAFARVNTSGPYQFDKQ
jgi:hypothetical protein